jgi:hypothetical protein
MGLRGTQIIGSISYILIKARTVSVYFKIAAMRAITNICEHKTEQLLGTKFTHIPCNTPTFVTQVKYY